MIRGYFTLKDEYMPSVFGETAIRVENKSLVYRYIETNKGNAILFFRIKTTLFAS